MTRRRRNLSSGGGLTCADPWNAVTAVKCRAYQNHKAGELKKSNSGGLPTPSRTLQGNAMSCLAKREDERDKSHPQADARSLGLGNAGEANQQLLTPTVGREAPSPGC